MTRHLSGVWAAVVTPVDERLEPDGARAVDYYAELLRDGCDGLNVLGTTGEAMSLTVAARRAFMETLANGALPRERMMIGTGAAALDDAAALTAAAFEFGFAAALVMPPFYYRDAGNDGIVAYFDRLLSRASPPPRGILLYNFPAMSGVTFGGELLDRLMTEFPEAIGGMKDSSNDAALQRAAIERYPHLRVFPSSEDAMLDAAAYGACGCISATVALSAQDAADVWTRREAAAVELRRLARRRAALTSFPLIAAMRRTISVTRGDPAWERPIPPLAPLSAEQQRRLQVAFGAA